MWFTRRATHTLCGSCRCGVEIDLEMGELSVPERPDVRLVLNERAAGASGCRLGVDEGHDLVALCDELSRFEGLEVECLRELAEPAEHVVLAAVGPCQPVITGIAGIHPLDVVGHDLGEGSHVASTESLVCTLGEAGVLSC